MMAARVSLVKGPSRYDNIRRGLELIEADIRLEPDQTIVVKPNLTSSTTALAITHVEALRAVLRFLRERTSASIIIAEGTGTAAESTPVAFKQFGYYALAQKFGVALVDLNKDTGVEVQLLNSRLQPMTIKVSRTLLEANYRVSVTMPKTHDTVVMTASLKNMIMAGPLRRQGAISERLITFISRHIPRSILYAPFMHGLRAQAPTSKDNYKALIHQGYPAMNMNLFLLARLLKPHLAVIDGFQGMEGEGPVGGREVALGLALASTDAVAADVVAAKIMGFDLEQIGYLHYCHRAGLGEGDLDKITILGERMEEHIRPFRPHSTVKEQLEWHLPEAETILSGAGVAFG
ncbi:MAG: DUF362 domain-containing protein [Dehalococcoidia bacterium]|nr:DUF362 domain-containing protein [Dehalococcoidia bacterium]